MKRLYVGNLPYQVSEADVQNAFAVYGPVRSCSIVRDRETGQSRGFAFVEMENDENALAAINGLNGQQLDGRALTVNEARPPQRSGGGG